MLEKLLAASGVSPAKLQEIAGNIGERVKQMDENTAAIVARLESIDNGLVFLANASKALSEAVRQLGETQRLLLNQQQRLLDEYVGAKSP